VAAVFADGHTSYAIVALIASRTLLIKNPTALGAVDADLATAITEWEPMSQDKTTAAIDALVDRHDPHAVRRTQNRARGRSVDISLDDAGGLATLFATLFGPDAKALDQRLAAITGTVCDADPRTQDQKRSDALGVLGSGTERLTCLCERPDCPAATAAPAKNTVVFVVAHDDTLTAQSPAAAAQDTALDGPQPRLFDKPQRDLTLTEALVDTDPGEPAATRPGVMLGGPVLPGTIIRRLALQAVIKRIIHPGASPPEPRHTPSTRLADFVRCRDLICRFPGVRHEALLSISEV
jgi:hypothetical protein